MLQVSESFFSAGVIKTARSLWLGWAGTEAGHPDRLEPMASPRLSCHHGNGSRPPGTGHPLGRIFREGSRRKRKWHVEGPVEAPVSKCRRFWKVLISAIHKAEKEGPPLLGR